MKRFSVLILSAVLAACSREAESPFTQLTLIPVCDKVLTRATDPDEQRITDYNLFIFNAFGVLEEKLYVPARQKSDTPAPYTTTLLKEVPYTILLAANLGYELVFHTLEEALDYRYYLAYPDEYSQGIPMAACLEQVTVGADNATLELPLQRLMARLDLQLDRSALNQDVRLRVTEVKVGNCPSSVRLFAESQVENSSQTFTTGFTKSGRETDPLNQDLTVGLSRPLSLYLLENCQGDLLEEIESEREKIFREGRYSDVCSYVELKVEYRSDTRHTPPGAPLVYRFYPGESLCNFDIRRNTRYQLVLRPEGDGLQESSWRVDQSTLLTD